MKIAIVDDKNRDAKRLMDTIQKDDFNDGSFSIDIFTDGLHLLDSLKKGYDAIFLDIDMPVMNGLELGAMIRQLDQSIPLVFVTNYASLAINGYGVSALDFLVKPVSEKDVHRTLEKIQAHMSKDKNDFKLLIKIKHGYKSVMVSQIKYVEVIEHDIIFHCVDGNYESHGTLKSIEETLIKYNFARCNYCYLVNLRYVDFIVDDNVIVDGETIAISRNKKKDFVKKFLEVVS